MSHNSLTIALGNSYLLSWCFWNISQCPKLIYVKNECYSKKVEKEKNFFTNYNHFISKKVVEFAIQNKAEQINLELLDPKGFDDELLRYWAYGELQYFIKYKAERKGLIVKYIDPYHTSQICSYCGHWEEGQRKNQSQFKCKNCGLEINADLNAAKNISKSTNYVDKIEDCILYKRNSDKE